ncbi:MAG: NADH-quinone oxidoreductase subunit J [Deltaproteobacteria bacterium]|nr:NADH-quinone oxidoreductase subunit J [Deltaproteobacteria bacterium]MBW2395226.1 NADH-quinone oxidoreductase subunit J [Deltaproteobacteria bacterium]
MSEWIFYAFAALAVAGALGMVLNVRNTVAGALSLVATMVSLGGIYVMLGAYLIGVLQILVYAGAIVVVFLFVVMLLNLREDGFASGRQWATKAVGATLGVAAAVGLIGLLPAHFPEAAALPEGFGGYRVVAALLFTDYVLAFEVSSLLLLSAMVGAVILARRSTD